MEPTLEITVRPDIATPYMPLFYNSFNREMTVRHFEVFYDASIIDLLT